jgi:hypothetical protein
LDELDELASRVSLLRFSDANAGHVAGKYTHREDGESVDASERRAARDELGWPDCQLVTDLHEMRL